jgi:hypothetical protein
MQERIKSHLDGLFNGAPKTRQVDDMYQELLAGCLDKFADLTAGGMAEDEAFKKVTDGIGDVSELLGYIEKREAFDPANAAEKRRKRAFFTSAGICGYFIAVAMFVLFMLSGRDEVALSILIAIAGISTMLIVYGRMTNVVTYEKADDTLVEEMKEQMTKGGKDNKIASLASSTLWSLVVTLYLVASFLSGRWDITWMMLPLRRRASGPCLGLLQPRREKEAHIRRVLVLRGHGIPCDFVLVPCLAYYLADLPRRHRDTAGGKAVYVLEG